MFRSSSSLPLDVLVSRINGVEFGELSASVARYAKDAIFRTETLRNVASGSVNLLACYFRLQVFFAEHNTSNDNSIFL
jgi:hypothetical protein